MILDVFQWVNRLKNKDFKNQHSKCKFSQKRVPEAVCIQTPKEPAQFSVFFGNLNIKNRWMVIFIERKRFCH